MATRIPIPPDLAASTLFAADHTCCKCNERGRPIQIHHIDENSANNDPSNFAVLCLLCHDETQIRGGFGRKLSAPLVIQYRDDWLSRVQLRRQKADELAAMRMAEAGTPARLTSDPVRGPSNPDLAAYIRAIPATLRDAYALAQPMWDSGVTFEMVQGSYNVTDVVVQILVRLASWFPDNHFDDRTAEQYFSSFISQRFAWHRALAEPRGLGTGGTIVGPITAASVLSDAEFAVEEIVVARMWGREGFDLDAWKSQWNDHV